MTLDASVNNGSRLRRCAMHSQRRDFAVARRASISRRSESGVHVMVSPSQSGHEVASGLQESKAEAEQQELVYIATL